MRRSRGRHTVLQWRLVEGLHEAGGFAKHAGPGGMGRLQMTQMKGGQLWVLMSWCAAGEPLTRLRPGQGCSGRHFCLCWTSIREQACRIRPARYYTWSWILQSSMCRRTWLCNHARIRIEKYGTGIEAHVDGSRWGFLIANDLCTQLSWGPCRQSGLASNEDPSCVYTLITAVSASQLANTPRGVGETRLRTK